jgi:hypothetical protein
VRALGPLRCLVARLRVEDEDADPVRMESAEPDGASRFYARSCDLELPARLPDSPQGEHIQALRVTPRSDLAWEDDRAAVRAPEDRAAGARGSRETGEPEQEGNTKEGAHARILGRNPASSSARRPVAATSKKPSRLSRAFVARRLLKPLFRHRGVTES